MAVLKKTQNSTFRYLPTIYDATGH